MKFEPTAEQKKRIELAREIVEKMIRDGSEFHSEAFAEKCASEHGVSADLKNKRGLET